MVAHQNPPFRLPATDIELVLAAGGVNGFRHIGVLDELEAQGIPLGTIHGVSVGAIVAAFYTNGYTPDQITEIFLEALEDCKDPVTVLLAGWKEMSDELLKLAMEGSLKPDPAAFMESGWAAAVGRMTEAATRFWHHGSSMQTFLSCLTLPDPLRVSIGGFVDLARPMRSMVERYNLRPQDNLNPIAADLFRQTLVSLRGKEHDLAHVLASACSLQRVFVPQWDHFEGGMRLLGDGATIHYSPAEFCRDSAIFSTFRPATEVPAEVKNWLYLFFTECEVHCPLAGNHRYVDQARHLVIETGDPDVAGLNFGLSAERCLKMRLDAQLTAREALNRAREQGKLANLR